MVVAAGRLTILWPKRATTQGWGVATKALQWF